MKNEHGVGATQPIVFLHDRAGGLCEVLQLVGTAALLVDRDGEVVGMNATAETCLGRELRVRNGRLTAIERSAAAALYDLVESAIAGRGGSEQVVIPRLGARPLIVQAVPFLDRALAVFHPACAMIIVLDAGKVTLPAEAQLREIFGLSWTEARLAVRLAAGDNLELAATSCDISYETARTMLKVAFQKTSTRRQAELVALVIRIGALPGCLDYAISPSYPARCGSCPAKIA